MPTNPLRYPCGTCARKFEEMEHLRQHIKDLHSPSSPPTSRSPPKQPIFQCGTPGCTRKFGKVEDLRQHTKDSHSSSSPPPKQPVFKCGAEGCEATAPFLKLPLLHQHTAQTHPKSKKKKVSSGLSTLASSPPGPPIAVTNTQSVLMTPQPSTSTSLAAQNSVARPDFPSVVSDTQEELLQRLRQLELRHMLINKSALKVGMHFVELAEDIIRSSTNDRRISFLKDLQERVEWMSKHNDVYSLAYSAKFRADVEKLLQSFGYDDKLRMKKAISEDDQVILHLLREVIYSRQEDILHLSDEKATGFTDALHKCIIMASDDTAFVLTARRLLRKLCAATKDFPPTLFVELDSENTHRQIGRGGFADIFLGRYRGQNVALKRLQVYQSDSNQMSKVLKYLSQEVLAWVHLKHDYVLPFLGLDKKTFDGYPPCIVTPYMRNGTMNDFVKSRNGTLPDRRVDRLLFETAQGLAYLHSKDIVHGDLRGGNVLIDDDKHAQLADFGLAIVTDATRGTTSQRGSLRWMAPELLDFEVEFKRTEASDVYAFACLCIEIYTGEQPFWSIPQDMAVVLQVLDKKPLPRPSSSGPPDGTRAMSDGLWAIVEACSTHKPSDRPDMHKVVGLIMASH